MKEIRKVNATKARNDFFNLLKRSYLEKEIILIEKGGIPMAYLTPVDYPQKERSVKRAQKKLLARLKKHRGAMTQTSNSVKLIRQMRRYGK